MLTGPKSANRRRRPELVNQSQGAAFRIRVQNIERAAGSGMAHGVTQGNRVTWSGGSPPFPPAR
jgi:hypothetical protein